MQRPRPTLLALMSALAVACGTTGGPPPADGEDSGDADADAGDDTSPPPPTTQADAGDADEGDDDGPQLPPPDPFDLDRTNIKLLPFRVRFNKLQALLGAPPEDPAFDVLRARRFELGDYDYAINIIPDLTWNAAKMSVWIAAMLPVCRSPQMHAKFPAFPDALDDLMAAAYGASASPDQLADYEGLLGDAALDDAARYDSVCAAVLTALEFVAQ